MYNLPNKQSSYMISNHITPEVFSSIGDDSAGGDKVAPWLPLQRFFQPKEIHVVISRGTPVAYCGPYLVPAGYKLEADAIKNGEAPTIKYTALDVQEGVLNFKGEAVKEGDSVLQPVIDAGQAVAIFSGIASYDYFQNQGDAPNTLRYMNFDPQPVVAYNMDCHYEYPLVATADDYAKAPLKGISAFIGTNIFPGQFVTYNKASQFVIASADFTYGSVKPEFIVGQVNRLYIHKDPATGVVTSPVNGTNRVINPADFTGNKLNELPGVRNGGITQKIQYANGYGTIRFGLQNR